ncbi:FadR/GntR family transcriptional regulator [Streptomyces bacillaris]|uniref:FadR/GntR family transcriptional regulator n=1 Tax=Streptomyces bacillaris TaxID=68179 RepID=UPI00362B28D6
MAEYVGRGLHGQIVETVGTRIVQGRLRVGETLDMAALIDELGISQTVLREAVKVLTAKGLVDARQKRGTFVRPREHWNLLDADVIRWQFAADAPELVLRDLAEVRLVIEPAAARLAAERRTEDDLAVLETALARMGETSGDPTGAAEADLAWHRALLRATHNELLQRMDVFIGPALAERDRLVHSAEADDPVPAHEPVLRAVRNADPAAAEQAMRALLARADADLARTAAPSRARPEAEADDDRTGRDGGHATRPKDREAP